MVNTIDQPIDWKLAANSGESLSGGYFFYPRFSGIVRAHDTADGGKQFEILSRIDKLFDKVGVSTACGDSDCTLEFVVYAVFIVQIRADIAVIDE